MPISISVSTSTIISVFAIENSISNSTSWKHKSRVYVKSSLVTVLLYVDLIYHSSTLGAEGWILQCAAMVSKFSVDSWKRFGRAVVPSDTKKFNKGNNSLIIRCGPQTVTRVSVLLWLGWSCAGSQHWRCVWNQRGRDGQEQDCSTETGEPGASNNSSRETTSVTPAAAAMGCHVSASEQGKQRWGWWQLSNLAMARWITRSQISQGGPNSNSWIVENGIGFSTASLEQGLMAPGWAEARYWPWTGLGKA